MGIGDARGKPMRGKKVIVGVTGGIAAYKAAELVRLLVREEVSTRVAMTANATRFVTPLTFEALSGNRVIWDMWGLKGSAMDHISWGQTADLIIIAPATANMVAKLAHGLADDFLSTMVLAATAKVLVCPAMNTQMYAKTVVQENSARAGDREATMSCAPAEGQLACGAEGMGRMPEPLEILERAACLLAPEGPLRNEDSRDGRPHGGADRSREIHYQSILRQNGLCPRWEGLRARRGCDACERTHSPQAAPRCEVSAGKDRRGDEGHSGGQPARVGCGDQGRSRGRLQACGNGAPEDKEDGRRADPQTGKESGHPGGAWRVKRRKGLHPGGLCSGDRGSSLECKAKARGAKHLDMIVANDVTRSDAGFDVDTNLVKIIDRQGANRGSALDVKG